MAKHPFEMVPLPTERSGGKPRKRGLPMMMDWGETLEFLEAHLKLCAPYVDLGKIVVGHSRLYTEDYYRAKLDLYRKHDVSPFIGGMFLEYVFATQPSKTNISNVSFSPNGKQILASEGDIISFRDGDKATQVWDVAAKRRLLVLNGHKKDIFLAAFSVDGNRIVTSSGDGTARLWNSRTGKTIAVFKGREKKGFLVRFGPKGAFLATSEIEGGIKSGVKGTGNGEVIIRDATTGVTKIKVTIDSPLGNVRFSPDGARLAVLAIPPRVFDVKTGKEVARLVGEDHVGSTSLAFDPSGETLATAYVRGSVKLWNARSGKLIRSLDGHLRGVWGVLFSPDGTLLLTVSSDKTHRLWDVATGRTLAVFRNASHIPNSGTFSPDGTAIALGGKGTRVWRILHRGQALVDHARRLVRRKLTDEERVLHRLD